MLNLQKLSEGLIKYLLEGTAVALAAFAIPKQRLSLMTIFLIASTAGLMFLVLDLFSPEMGQAARIGAGLGIGAKAVGFERFNGARMNADENMRY